MHPAGIRAKEKGKAKGKRTSSDPNDTGRGGHRQNKPRKNEETAPHILAALEAQRARSLALRQQQEQQQQEEGAPTSLTATTATPATVEGSRDSGSWEGRRRQRKHRATDGHAPNLQPPQAQQRKTLAITLPGYFFDPHRNRYFKAIKGVTPPASVRHNAETFPRKPQRPQQLQKKHPAPYEKNDAMHCHAVGDSLGATSVGGGGGGATQAGEAVVTSGEGSKRRSCSFGRRGLHCYAMNRRKGLWGAGGGLAGNGGFEMRHGGGPPAAPERVRRAAIESIVSSTRFRARLAPDVPSIAGACTVDWFAEKGLLALGSIHGESIIRLAPGPQRGNEENLQLRRGQERRNSFNISWENSQVSDIRFRSFDGKECACATAWLGGVGKPGSVKTIVGDDEAIASMAGFGGTDSLTQRNIRTSELQLPRGSVWCIEWDPHTDSRLAVGTSSNGPVRLWDIETRKVTPVATLTSDVFSIAFLPSAAPGAGNAMLCGLRNGSVVMLDARVPHPFTPKISSAGPEGCAAAFEQSESFTSFRNGVGRNSRRNSRRLASTPRFSNSDSVRMSRRCGDGSGFFSTNIINDQSVFVEYRSGQAHVARDGNVNLDSNTLATLTSSIAQLNILTDGRRCLVKDKAGGLQVLDTRFPGRGPVRVLMPPVVGQWGAAEGKFAVDSAETVVVAPIVTGKGRVTANAQPVASVISAWDPFSDETRGVSDHFEPAAGDNDEVGGDFNSTSSGGCSSGSNKNSRRVIERNDCTGDRLRIFSLTSGDVLSENVTPWKMLTLARGQVGRREKRVNASAGAGCSGEMTFSGLATGAKEEDAGESYIFTASVCAEKGG